MPFLIGELPSSSSWPIRGLSHVSLALGSPEADPELQVQCWAEGEDHLPLPDCSALPHAAHNPVSLLCCNFMPVALQWEAPRHWQTCPSLLHGLSLDTWGRKGWKWFSRESCLWPTTVMMIKTIYFTLYTWNHFKSCLHCTACGWKLSVQLSFCNLILQNMVLVCIGVLLHCSDIAERHKQLNPLQESVIQQIQQSKGKWGSRSYRVLTTCFFLKCGSHSLLYFHQRYLFDLFSS